MSALAASIAVRPHVSTITEHQSDEAHISELISRAKIGDRQAFAALYKQHVQVVHSYVRAKMGNSLKAEDITAEVFVRALKNINRYEFQGVDFSAWLLRIARNLVFDNSRMVANKMEVPADVIPEGAGLADDSSIAAIASLDAQYLRQAVTNLGAEQQEVLDLRFVKGLSVAETAARMSRSDGAVRVLQFRALKAMKKQLDKIAPGIR